MSLKQLLRISIVIFSISIILSIIFKAGHLPLNPILSSILYSVGVFSMFASIILFVFVLVEKPSKKTL